MHMFFYLYLKCSNWYNWYKNVIIMSIIIHLQSHMSVTVATVDIQLDHKHKLLFTFSNKAKCLQYLFCTSPPAIFPKKKKECLFASVSI